MRPRPSRPRIAFATRLRLRRLDLDGPDRANRPARQHLHRRAEEADMKLSVVLPTRNGGAMLEGCLRSVLSQSFADMELVVSDNASTDDTPEILRRSRERRSPEGRAGGRAARGHRQLDQRACAASSGDYLLLIGDDDYLLPGYCERIARADRALTTTPTASPTTPMRTRSRARSRDTGTATSPIRSSSGIRTCRPPGRSHGSCDASSSRDFFRFRFRIHLNLQTTIVSAPGDRADAQRLPEAALSRTSTRSTR